MKAPQPDWDAELHYPRCNHSHDDVDPFEAKYANVGHDRRTDDKRETARVRIPNDTLCISLIGDARAESHGTRAHQHGARGIHDDDGLQLSGRVRGKIFSNGSQGFRPESSGQLRHYSGRGRLYSGRKGQAREGIPVLDRCRLRPGRRRHALGKGAGRDQDDEECRDAQRPVPRRGIRSDACVSCQRVSRTDGAGNRRADPYDVRPMVAVLEHAGPDAPIRGAVGLVLGWQLLVQRARRQGAVPADWWAAGYLRTGYQEGDPIGQLQGALHERSDLWNPIPVRAQRRQVPFHSGT